MTSKPWLKSYLTPGDLDKIEQTVAQAEKTTSGEIVPIIVRRSSTVGHVPLILFVIGLLLYYVLGISEWHIEYLENGWWILILWVILLFPLTRLLASIPAVQYMMVNRLDRQSQANMRAETEFYEAGLNKTDGSTGILLFISLMEHHAVVLADKGISQKLPQESWTEVVNLMLQGAKSKDLGGGLCQAIEKCGSILSEYFPIEPDDQNELPNKLILKE